MLFGPPVELSADLAVPVGMALHELTTNAIQYGALSAPGGYVEIRWDVVAVEGVRTLHLELARARRASGARAAALWVWLDSASADLGNAVQCRDSSPL